MPRPQKISEFSPPTVSVVTKSGFLHPPVGRPSPFGTGGIRGNKVIPFPYLKKFWRPASGCEVK
jgi:hypothetical protein